MKEAPPGKARAEPLCGCLVSARTSRILRHVLLRSWADSASYPHLRGEVLVITIRQKRCPTIQGLAPTAPSEAKLPACIFPGPFLIAGEVRTWAGGVGANIANHHNVVLLFAWVPRTLPNTTIAGGVPWSESKPSRSEEMDRSSFHPRSAILQGYVRHRSPLNERDIKR